MRTVTLLSALALLAAANATPGGYSPFLSPFTNNPQPLQINLPIGTNGTNGTQAGCLQRRQNGCPTISGTTYGLCPTYAGICCPANTNCDLDQANNYACCPYGASCTGTVGGVSPGYVTSSATSGYFLGGTTTTTATPYLLTSQAGVYGGGSTVPNAIYPFVYIPSSYVNAALCSSYYTSCQIQSSSCYAALGGGAGGITIAGVTTNAGASTTLAPASAAAVCSALSISACYGLQSATQCNGFGTGTVVAGTTTTSGLIASAAAGPRVTSSPEMMYAIGAGALVGAAGVLI